MLAEYNKSVAMGFDKEGLRKTWKATESDFMKYAQVNMFITGIFMVMAHQFFTKEDAKKPKDLKTDRTRYFPLMIWTSVLRTWPSPNPLMDTMPRETEVPFK